MKKFSLIAALSIGMLAMTLQTSSAGFILNIVLNDATVLGSPLQDTDTDSAIAPSTAMLNVTAVVLPANVSSITAGATATANQTANSAQLISTITVRNITLNGSGITPSTITLMLTQDIFTPAALLNTVSSSFTTTGARFISASSVTTNGFTVSSGSGTSGSVSASTTTFANPRTITQTFVIDNLAPGEDFIITGVSNLSVFTPAPATALAGILGLPLLGLGRRLLRRRTTAIV